MKFKLCLLALLAFTNWNAILLAAQIEVVPTPSDGMVPDAEVDRKGTIHVAYVSSDDAYYVKSSDAGESFSAPIRINSEPGTAHPPNMYRGPDLAIGKDGQVHVIWYCNAFQRKLPQGQWGVMYSHLNEAKNAFVPSRNLNHKPSDNYSLAADGDGRVAVFWMADGLFYNLSKDGGERFADAVKIPGADTCECCASRAFASADGALHCAYRDKANNIRDMFLLTQAKGQSAFTKEKISVTPWEVKGCPMTGTFLTGDKNGLVTAWETKGQVFFTRSDRNGRSASSKEIAAPVRGGKWPIALIVPDRSVLMSWKNGTTLEWQLYDASDKPVGEKKSKAGSNPHRHAGVVTASGNFVLID